MRNHTIARLAAVTAATLGLSLSAAAADVYVGASVGATNWHTDDVPGVSIDKTDTGWKLFGGAAFSQNLAVEGGYVSLGKAKLSATGGSGELKGDGLFVDLVGMVPFSSSVSGFIKFGLFNGHAKVSASGLGGSLSDSDSGTDITYGFGVSFALSKNAQLRAEWERFRLKAFGDKGDTDMLSVGVTWQF